MLLRRIVDLAHRVEQLVALEPDGVGYEGEQAARAELSDIEGSPVRMVKIVTRVFRVVTEKKQGRGRYSLWVDGYRFEVEALDSHEADLEDVFLEQYRRPADAR